MSDPRPGSASEDRPGSPGRRRAGRPVVLLLACLASCSPSPPPAPPAASSDSPEPPGDWLVWGDNSEPSSLNCARATDRAARQICRLVADTLIDLDQEGRFVARLARRFDLSADGTALTFHLPGQVRWHDGAPFSARDVLYTVELTRKLDPSGELFGSYFGPMTSIVSLDETTVRATYSEPFAGALAGWREIFIMPAHLPFDPASASPLDRAPVGTGPFRFVSWEARQQIVLQANTLYVNGRPGVDRFIYRIIPDQQALTAAAQQEEVDVAHLTADWLADHPAPHDTLPFRVVTYPSRYMEMIYWNLRPGRGLFGDPRVRRALTLLLDRQGYSARVQGGIYRPAGTLIDPELWGGNAGLAPLPFDPAAARRLLDEAGVVDRDGDGVREGPEGPFAFTLLYSGISTNQRQIATLLESAAASAGLRVTLQGLDWSILRDRVRSHRFDAVVYRWSLEPVPDPRTYFHSSQAASGFNFGGYASRQFDAAADEYRRTLDPARSRDLLFRMQEILHEDQPCTFVAVSGAIVSIHRRFRTPEITSSGLWNWYPSILSWRVPADRRRRG